MNLPAIRFVRCFDVFNLRMVNIWMNISTQEQLDNPPKAVELQVTAQTVEDCMFEIRKWNADGLDFGTIEEIEKASKLLLDAQPSVYEAKR